MNIHIRRVEPGDYKAVCAVHAQPNALAGTLQLPFPSEEAWKERLAKFGEREYGLVACVEGEFVGILSLQVSPFFLLMKRRPPRSALFPHTTLFRSAPRPTRC